MVISTLKFYICPPICLCWLQFKEVRLHNTRQWRRKSKWKSELKTKMHQGYMVQKNYVRLGHSNRLLYFMWHILNLQLRAKANVCVCVCLNMISCALPLAPMDSDLFSLFFFVCLFVFALYGCSIICMRSVHICTSNYELW